MQSKRGGKRPGAGRKKGALTQRTRLIAEKLTEQGITPLEVMLEAMRDAYKAGGAMGAAAYAKECAPYVHPKLANINADVKQDLTIELVSFADADPG